MKYCLGSRLCGQHPPSARPPSIPSLLAAAQRADSAAGQAGLCLVFLGKLCIFARCVASRHTAVSLRLCGYSQFSWVFSPRPGDRACRRPDLPVGSVGRPTATAPSKLQRLRPPSLLARRGPWVRHQARILPKYRGQAWGLSIDGSLAPPSGTEAEGALGPPAHPRLAAAGQLLVPGSRPPARRRRLHHSPAKYTHSPQSRPPTRRQ
jgi:hypothetical protein